MKYLAAALALALLLSGCEKNRLDQQVRELCAKDGGIKVYESVTLPSDRFDRTGMVNFFRPTQGERALGPEYIFREDRRYYRKGNPEMWRVHTQIVRRADGKILSEESMYARRGGDLIPLPMPDSSFVCPPLKDLGLIEKTFVKQR